MTTLISSRYARWAAVILVLGTIFRLWYSTHLELVGDEAYYWLWSRHPDYCYLDKGPVIAWFISAGTALFGQTVFGIRFFATLLALGTGIGIFFLARRLFSDRVAFWSVVAGGVDAALCGRRHADDHRYRLYLFLDLGGADFLVCKRTDPPWMVDPYRVTGRLEHAIEIHRRD